MSWVHVYAAGVVLSGFCWAAILPSRPQWAASERVAALLVLVAWPVTWVAILSMHAITMWRKTVAMDRNSEGRIKGLSDEEKAKRAQWVKLVRQGCAKAEQAATAVPRELQLKNIDAAIENLQEAAQLLRGGGAS